MKTELEVLYAEQTKDGDGEIVSKGPTPVVRYSDACAAIERLESDVAQKEQLRANAVRRCEVLLTELESLSATCERLQAELMAARYGQQAVDTMLTTIQNGGRSVRGRWDGPAKVL